MTRQYSQHAVEWIVDRLHVSTPDAAVKAEIEKRTASWPKGQRRLAIRDALKRHYANGSLYAYVMRGAH
jgi:hypothetical protein